jgi:hypothetical protein
LPAVKTRARVGSAFGQRRTSAVVAAQDSALRTVHSETRGTSLVALPKRLIRLVVFEGRALGSQIGRKRLLARSLSVIPTCPRHAPSYRSLSALAVASTIGI